MAQWEENLGCPFALDRCALRLAPSFFISLPPVHGRGVVGRLPNKRSPSNLPPPNYTSLHVRFSLLHYAAISGWEGTVGLLMDHGADPRQTCLTGETALHFAVALGHGKAAEVLLKRCPALVNEGDKVSPCESRSCVLRSHRTNGVKLSAGFPFKFRCW